MPYDQTQTQTQTIGTFLATFGLIFGLFSLALFVFLAIVYWKIFAKAGYSGAMGLLMFVPIANIIVICMLAFGTWPIYQELNQLRQRVGMAGGPQYPQNPQGSQYPQNPQGPQYPQNPQYPQYR